MRSIGFERRWLQAVGALCLAALIVAGCGRADRDAAPVTTPTTTVTQPDITLPARVDGAVPMASLAGLVDVVDQVGYTTTAATNAAEPSATDSVHRSLVVTRGSLRRYAVLLIELDDDGLNELAALLEELVEGVDELAAEVAAGRTDFATAVTNLENRLEAIQRAWAARADDWEEAWRRAGREWQAEWDRAAPEWEAEWDRAAVEWESDWAEAAAEWDAHWEQVAEDWEQAWEDAGTNPDPPATDEPADDPTAPADTEAQEG